MTHNGNGIPKKVLHKIFQPYLPQSQRGRVQDWAYH